MDNLGSEIIGLFPLCFSGLSELLSQISVIWNYSALSIYLFYNYNHYLKGSLLVKRFPFHCHSLSLSITYTFLPYPSPPHRLPALSPSPSSLLPTVAPLTIGPVSPSAPVLNSWRISVPKLPFPLTLLCWKPPPSGSLSRPALREPGTLSLFQLLYRYIHWATLFCSLVWELFTGMAWPFFLYLHCAWHV